MDLEAFRRGRLMFLPAVYDRSACTPCLAFLAHLFFRCRERSAHGFRLPIHDPEEGASSDIRLAAFRERLLDTYSDINRTELDGKMVIIYQNVPRYKRMEMDRAMGDGLTLSPPQVLSLP